jgi:hypothetical protein
MKVINSPMTDYNNCLKNETESQCCAGLK